ncbi:transglutaminase family protein [uncultured Ferrovibrio sp.]|jgi:transglutaminase-like putative cysteine protease|uniref:transglutaminase-like domain-containing protein n=1 Tax=uncultured Ferrovibrio sp. TaxID=1576913 RepID=UPI00262609A8|nr:transglutaminase family protein [uncultured Ferrovibrio sp.]
MAASAETEYAVDPAYLAATPFIEKDHPLVRALAREAVGDERDPKAKAIKLYYAVRDRFYYDPYAVELTQAGMCASGVIARGRGFCVNKAVLMAAVARAEGIPARLGFADVKNHLATARLRALMGTDVFYYHGYAELFLDGKWVKATPAFNLELCQKFRVLPLEFDGETDSIFHPFDADNRRHMEYIADRGTFADLPFEQWRAAMLQHYPYMNQSGQGGDFAAEAAAENQNQSPSDPSLA